MLVPRKGPVTRNTRVKYQSSSTHCLVKVSDRMADKTKNIIPTIVQFTHYLNYKLEKNNDHAAFILTV